MKKKSSFDNGLRLRILTRHQAPALGAPLSILSTGKMDVRQGVNLKLSGVERKCRLHTVFDFAVIPVTSLLTLTYYL
ncbi:hypothetical protein [Prevotella melaninogenica]|uniref:hypothetical protein n=1 Tax=Prevotella melaninogenica TaxID=28132 RepID=UPI0001AEB382|nr:hypothetical protein [Prevotella melaninogenica]UEB08617.1 hypothetical protein LK441_09795 [Prevotella melaninogenica]